MTDPLASVFIEASPLIELHYTGISNVTYEIVRRAKADPDLHLTVSVSGRILPEEQLSRVLMERSGRPIKEFFSSFETLEAWKKRKPSAEYNKTIALFMNTKPLLRLFPFESMVFYDFSPLLIPECHTRDTINYHTRGLSDQVHGCDLAFCISESTARDLRWLFGYPAEKIEVCHLGHGADVELMENVSAILGERATEKYLLVLGTIEPRKNIRLVLEWLKSNRSVLDEFRVVFVGRQGWGESFSSMIIERGLERYIDQRRISYLDYVSETTKVVLMRCATALVFPSLFEGFGLPVAEAMIAETPVICSVSTSLPEVLGDGGYYFDPYSIESFSSAFALFCADYRTGKIRSRICEAKRRALNFSYDTTYSSIKSSLIGHSHRLTR